MVLPLTTLGGGNGVGSSGRNGLVLACLAAALSLEFRVPKDESDSGGVRGAMFEEMTFA